MTSVCCENRPDFTRSRSGQFEPETFRLTVVRCSAPCAETGRPERQAGCDGRITIAMMVWLVTQSPISQSEVCGGVPRILLLGGARRSESVRHHFPDRSSWRTDAREEAILGPVTIRPSAAAVLDRHE